MFSIGFLTLDVIIVIVLALIFFFWGILRGGKNLTISIISIYITSIIYSYPPFPFSTNSSIRLVVFFGLTTIVYFLIRKNIKMSRSVGKKPFTNLLLTLGTLILLFTLYYHVLPINDLYSFTLPFESLFVSLIPTGLLFLIPVLVLFFVSKKTD